MKLLALPGDDSIFFTDPRYRIQAARVPIPG